MYSKNDYRYYLERRLDSDYLAHERSHKYIKKIGDRYFYTQQELAAFLNKDNPKKVTLERRVDPTTGTRDYRIDFNKHEHWSDGVGVRITPKSKYGPKSISVYDTTKTKWDSKNDDYVYEKKTKGRVTKERAEDGVSYTVDLSKKKSKVKNSASDVTKGLSRGISGKLNERSTVDLDQERGVKRTKEHQTRELNRILDKYNRELDNVKKEYHGSRTTLSDSTTRGNVKQANDRGKKQTARVKSQRTIKTDQVRGRTRTEQLRDSGDYRPKKTKTAPNMYSTAKKSEGYSTDRFNHTTTYNNKMSITTYGQRQKKKDMKSDIRQRNEAINNANPYKYDTKKSVKSNLKSNSQVSERRRQLKRKAKAQVEKNYSGSSSKLGSNLSVTHDVKIPDKIEYDKKVPDKIEYDKKVRRR